MFSRRSKQEPVTRYDPRVDRPQPSIPSRPIGPSGLNHLAKHLDHFTHLAPRPLLPPDNLVREHDPQLADLIHAVADADRVAASAADSWQDRQPGSRGFGAVVAETREWARHLIASGKTPAVEQAPIYHHLVAGQAEAYTGAVVAEARAADAYERMLRHARNANDLKDHLDKSCDVLRDDQAELYRKAEVDGDEDAFRDAKKLGIQWLEQSALYEWMVDPTKAYRTRQPGAFPQDIAHLEHRAAVAIGEYRAEVPREAMGPDAPPAIFVKPGSRKESEPLYSGPVSSVTRTPKERGQK